MPFHHPQISLNNALLSNTNPLTPFTHSLKLFPLFALLSASVEECSTSRSLNISHVAVPVNGPHIAINELSQASAYVMECAHTQSFERKHIPIRLLKGTVCRVDLAIVKVCAKKHTSLFGILVAHSSATHAPLPATFPCPQRKSSASSIQRILAARYPRFNSPLLTCPSIPTVCHASGHRTCESARQ